MARFSRVNKPLHAAASHGDLPALKALIAQGDDINERGADGCPLIVDAAHSGHVEIVRWLLDNGADGNATDSSGMNVLHHAARRGRAAVVRLLLDRGFDPDQYSGLGGDTSLHRVAAHAPRTSDLETATALLDGGATVDSRNSWGMTPLMIAVHGRRQNLIDLLLDRGADINVRSHDGGTPLIHAARYGVGGPDTCLHLLKRGADVNAANDAGMTTLMWASLDADRPCIQILLEHAAAPNGQDTQGKTALMYAAGPPPVASYIGQLNQKEVASEKPMRRDNRRRLDQAWQNRADAVRLLLTSGADRAIRDTEGKTALDWAIAQPGGQAVVEALHG